MAIKISELPIETSIADTDDLIGNISSVTSQFTLANLRNAVLKGANALSDGANIATDLSLGSVHTVTIAGNRTLDNPTNKVVGQRHVWVITQDGTGNRTLAFGTDFDFIRGNTITPTAAAVSVIVGTVISSSSIRCEMYSASMSLTGDLIFASSKGLDFSADSKGIFKGIESIVYRLNTDIVGNDDPLGQTGGEWEISDDIDPGTTGDPIEMPLGSTPVTESNGIFSFASTGYWLINFTLLSRPDTLDNAQVGQISATNDNSTYAPVAQIDFSATTTTGRSTSSNMVLLKIIDIANDKVKTVVTATSGSHVTEGDTSFNETNIMFLKLADI